MGIVNYLGEVELEEDAGGTDIADEYLGNDGAPLGMESDFMHLLRQRAEAGMLNGHQLDDFGREVRAGQLKKEEEHAISPFRQINPQSAETALLGGEAVVVSGQAEQQLVFWTGPEIDARAVTIAISNVGRTGGTSTSFVSPYNGNATIVGPYTVDNSWPLGNTSVAGDPADEISYRPYAVILWGTRIFHRVVVDVTKGFQLTVNGSAVFVSLGMDVAPSGQDAGKMLLAGSLGFFASQRLVPTTRTLYFDNMAAGAESVQVIPLFAQCLLPIQRLNPTESVQLDFESAAGSALYKVVLTAGSYMTQPIPMSGDVYQVRVTNTGASSSNYRLMFGLSL